MSTYGSKTARVRELAARGMSAIEIEAETGYSRSLVHKAMHTPAKPAGRPRLPRCEHCGQPIPAKAQDE
jgi:hypothetical protein